jgi:hypothetical protein
MLNIINFTLILYPLPNSWRRHKNNSPQSGSPDEHLDRCEDIKLGNPGGIDSNSANQHDDYGRAESAFWKEEMP